MFGAYLHVEIFEVAVLNGEDEMVGVFCEYKQYKSYIGLEKNKIILYHGLDKAQFSNEYRST